jgi:hypothetical protein
MFWVSRIVCRFCIYIIKCGTEFVLRFFYHSVSLCRNSLRNNPLQCVCRMVRLLYFSKTVLTILTAVNIIFTFQPSEAKGAKPREIGIVTTKRLNIRPEPGIMKPPLKVIERGTKVYILGHTNGWLKIKHGTHVGYIRNLKRFIRIISIGTPSEKLTGDSNHDIKQFKKEAEDISQKIEKGKTQVLTFTKKEASIANSLNDIDLSINNIRKQISAIKSELASLEKRIEETNNLSMDLKKKS